MPDLLVDNEEKPANPKQAFGDKKPDLRLLPLSGQLAQWEAHRDGANKYGAFNWRKNPVEANTYINAAKRHLELFAAGEEKARDTGVKNLGAVMACCAILLDAQLHGTMIDNREKSKEECDLLHLAEEMVKKLREAQAERDEAKKPYNWRAVNGVYPDLTGYRKIEVKYNMEPRYIPQVHSILEVDPGQHGYGIDWYGISHWRPVYD